MTPETRRTDRTALAGGIAAQLLTIGIARFAFTPLMPLMQAQAGLSYRAGAWLGSAIYLGYLAGTMTLVAVRDPATRYRLFRLCLVVAVISTFAMVATTNVWAWALLRCLAGACGVGGMLLASEFVLQQLMRSRQDANLGLHFSGLGLGIVLTGVATMLSAGARWDTQWLILGCIALALFVVAWRCVPRPRPTHDRVPAVGDGQAANGRWMWMFSGGYFTAGWGYAMGATFAVAILAKGGGASLPTSSIGWILIGISAAAGSMASAYIVRHLDVDCALIGCYIAQIIALLLLAVPGSSALAILGSLLFGATFLAIVSIALTMSALRSPHAPGRAMARMTLSYGVGQIAGPAVTGYVISGSGNYVPALLISATVMTAGIACLIMARISERCSLGMEEAVEGRRLGST